jgi:hypothetical protein
MKRIQLVGLALALSACQSTDKRADTFTPVETFGQTSDYYKEGEGDAEPYDPAEERPAIMPPTRASIRGAGGPTWIERGPAPTTSAQVRVPPDFEVSGAVHALAPHPTNADILYAATVNGGIWRTNDARAARPAWAPLTDDLPSMSMASISFDPTDTTYQTLVAGIGRWSNFARRGDDEIGLYRTTDGGLNWSLLGGTTLVGQRLVNVEARGALIVAASYTGGVYRSTDTGATFTLVSGSGGLPAGGISDFTFDRTQNTRIYAAIRTGTFVRSDDFGQTWITLTAVPQFTASSTRVRLSVGANGTVYAAIANGGALAAVVRSTDQGVTWTTLDVPAVHPGGQAESNTSLAASPTDPNVVFVAGDRITASPFTGNVARLNAALAAGSQVTFVVDAGASNTAPHADSRDMEFDAAGELIQSDDGGIYRLRDVAGVRTWASVIGNMNVMEVHDLDHDSVANVFIIGTQDNGTHIQALPNDPRWRFINGGDGGDVLADDRSLAPGESHRYLSSQNLGGFRRPRFNASNVQQSSTSIATSGIVTDPQFVTPIELSATDPNRLIVGGTNTLYEATNAASTSPTLVSIGTPGANRGAIALGAVGAPDVAYVGRGAQVFKRAPGTTTFVATTATPAGAATISDVAIDPDDFNRVWAIDDNQIFRTTDGGTTWQDVTGNIAAVSSFDFRTIEFMPGNTDRVALGTRSGVFIANADSSVWSLHGVGLPDVLVYDLRYDPRSGLLHAGTLGRGVWSLPDPDFVFRNSFE